ncbi:MAG: type II toxin-antitoxin system VapC family toxin [Bryobacteraceae bacterium]
MNGYLLDTNVALLAGHQSRSLSPAVRAAIEEGPLFLSPLAYWEVVLKAMKGALDVGDPRQWWTETLDALAAKPLHYKPEHIAAICDLPPIHRDPFDRAR